MTHEEKLVIAKMVYREIIEAINKFQSQDAFHICVHWAECISVDDELFYGYELAESEEECKIIYFEKEMKSNLGKDADL